MIEKLYTVEEVAELASVTGRTIRNYLKSGRLVGRKIGGQWRFPESEVQRLLTGGDSHEAAYEEEDNGFSPAEEDPHSEDTELSGVTYSEEPAQTSPSYDSYSSTNEYVAPAPLPGPSQPPEDLYLREPADTETHMPAQHVEKPSVITSRSKPAAPVQRQQVVTEPSPYHADSSNYMPEPPVHESAPSPSARPAEAQNTYVSAPPEQEPPTPVATSFGQIPVTTREYIQPEAPTEHQSSDSALIYSQPGPYQQAFTGAAASYQPPAGTRPGGQATTPQAQSTQNNPALFEQQPPHISTPVETGYQPDYSHPQSPPPTQQGPGTQPLFGQQLAAATHNTPTQLQENPYNPYVYPPQAPAYGSYPAPPQGTYASSPPVAPAAPYPTPPTQPSLYGQAPAGYPYINASAPEAAPSISISAASDPVQTPAQPSAPSATITPAGTEKEASIPAEEDYPPPAARPEPVDLPPLSDVGKRVTKFISEVHDCSNGPLICSVIDLHQSLPLAKQTSERLNEIARQESESGTLCKCFVEYDERFYVARYTLFGSSSYLNRSLKLIG